MRRIAITATLALALALVPTRALADDAGTIAAGVIGGAVVLANVASTFTFAAVDISYAVKGTLMHRGWSISEVVFGVLSVVAGGINLGVGLALPEGSQAIFVTLGSVVTASGVWFVAHGGYHLHNDRDSDADVPISFPSAKAASRPAPLAFAPFVAPLPGGAMAGVGLRF